MDGQRVLKPQPKEQPFRSEKFLAFIRRQPCTRPGCWDRNTVPHHEQKEHQGTMGGKAPDDRCLPLCTFHHRMRHDQGRGVWWEWGVDPEAEIARLFAEWQGRD